MSFISAIAELNSAGSNNRHLNEQAVQSIINKAKLNELTVEEVARFATVCALSGERLEFLKQKYIIADIASTGGPSSLSTLLCPLYLVLLGTNVAKLGVPGRPAGGIDVLAQIEGYNTDLNANQIYQTVKKCGYAHFNAGLFAPLDAQIFRYRQQNNAQSIPDLVIASLLSKKLCVGVKRIGLDVRVSPFGNFGATMDEARVNAYRFCEVAHFLDKEAFCFLTNGSAPYQPYIGRGEALYALNEIFLSSSNKALRDHDLLCFNMAKELAGVKCAHKPKNSDLKKIFINNIESQGGSSESYYNTVKKIEKSHVFEIVSTDNGILEIDLHLIRSIIVDVQKKYFFEKNVFPDPCGLILKSLTGQRVKKGDLLATLRCNGDEKKDLIEKFSTAFRTCEKTITSNNSFEVVKSA